MTSAEKCSVQKDLNRFIQLSPDSLAAPGFMTDKNSGLSLPIRLLNWNVQKISNSGWQQDLVAYAQGSNMVLLQEATEHIAIEQQLSHLNFHSLAPGYHDGAQQTGVYTAAQVSPLSSCYQQHHEPWLRTPKAMQLSWYPIQGSQATLLVVNVHSVNFALGLKDYRRQLMAIVDMLEVHEGPVILSGDFNTWNPRRLALLNRHATEHGLSAIDFVDDKRTYFYSWFYRATQSNLGDIFFRS
mgnify:FL=1